jgi:hypothetical protein
MQQLAMNRFGAAEDSGQRVVILCRHGIKLVVVAAGATERKTEKRLAHRIDLLIDNIHAQLFLVGVADDFGAQHKKARRDDLLVPLFLFCAWEKIPRDLLAHELISAFGSGINGLVYALAVSGSSLYAGGHFTTAGGKVSAYIAKAS